MTLPEDFNPNGVTKIKPLDAHLTQVSYGTSRRTVVVDATPAEVERAISKAKADADSDPKHT